MILCAVCLAVFLVLLATDMNLFEGFVTLIEQHESRALDELAVTWGVLAAGLGIFAVRRSREAMRDSARRGQMEQTLEHDHALLRTLIDALPDYIFVKDAEGRFVLSNQAHAQAVNAPTPDALVGKTAFDFFPAELAAQFDADDRAIMQSGMPLISRERQTVNADGSRIWVSTTKVPLRDARGNVSGLVGISRDIGDRKQAEEALRDSEARFRAMFEQAAVGIAHSAPDGRWLLVNQMFCDITGYTQEEILSTSKKKIRHESR